MVVVGDGGTVLRSANAGGTWATESIAGAGDLYGVTSDWYGDVIVTVDSNGAIWTSTDRGLTFAREGTASAPLESVESVEDGSSVLAAGHNGVAMLRSSSGSWTPLTTGAGVNLHAALVADSGARLYVAGDNGTLLTSIDSGASWSAVALGTNLPLYGLQDL
jgi:photosystem II stability/assembly factor-like uncharacterized protein